MSCLQQENECFDSELELEAYSEQYSMVIDMVKQFLGEVKESVQRYLQKTRFPTYLNKGIISKWAMNLEQSLNKDCTFNSKKEYEFSEILVQCKRNILNLIDFEKRFKKQFQQNCFKKGKTSLSSSSSTTECSKIQKGGHKLLDFCIQQTKPEPIRQQYNKQLKQSKQPSQKSDDVLLRKQLRRIMLPKKVNFQQSNLQTNTSDIINRLEDKMLKIKSILANQKQRQNNIIEIFDKKKIIVPDINTQDPGVESLLKQIQQLKTTILQKELKINILQNKMQAINENSIIVQRYTIPKGQSIPSQIQDIRRTNQSINLNLLDSNSVTEIRSSKFGDQGFKKKQIKGYN